MGFALKNIQLPHYTYEDYCQWEGRWELIDGIPYSMSETKKGLPQAMSPAPNLKHQDINTAIVQQLRNLLADCSKCTAIMYIDWKIDKDIVVQPDASVVCRMPKNKTHLDFPPSLIFEILSPSTAQKDRTIKYKLYEKQKVKYYIIVNPESRTAEIYEFKNKAYKKVKETSKEKFIFAVNGCNIKFNFSKIW